MILPFLSTAFFGFLLKCVKNRRSVFQSASMTYLSDVGTTFFLMQNALKLMYSHSELIFLRIQCSLVRGAHITQV